MFHNTFRICNQVDLLGIHTYENWNNKNAYSHLKREVQIKSYHKRFTEVANTK